MPYLYSPLFRPLFVQRDFYKYMTPLIGLNVSWSFTLGHLEQPDSLTHTLTGTHFTPG